MSYSPDHLLSALFRIYRAAQPARQQGEAFLEHALAAALSEPGVWRRVAEHTGFAAPPADPKVTTQDVVENGRTDITLTGPVTVTWCWRSNGGIPRRPGR